LEQQIAFHQKSGLVAYPGMMVNNLPYFGNLEEEYMIEEICASLTDPGEYCTKFMKGDKLITE
jgi:hypothetical protein